MQMRRLIEPSHLDLCCLQKPIIIAVAVKELNLAFSGRSAYQVNTDKMSKHNDDRARMKWWFWHVLHLCNPFPPPHTPPPPTPPKKKKKKKKKHQKKQQVNDKQYTQIRSRILRRLI